VIFNEDKIKVILCYFCIQFLTHTVHYTDKKENKIFLIYKEIQMGSGAKSYMRKGFLIYEEMRKYFTINEEAVSHI
jgi:hypothetical protein